MGRRRIGVVGFGHLGQYLVEKILHSDQLQLAFVWNRSAAAVASLVAPQYVLENLADFAERKADLIVEVAHPCISQEYGELFLKEADYLVGSPTAFADALLEATLRRAASSHALYVATGALWGGEDIKKMADNGSLQALRISMTKHPSSFKLSGPLKEANDSVTDKSTTLYDGPVRALCTLAPNNVNTMATAAIAAHNLGMDRVQGRLVADPALENWHVVEVEAWGPGDIAAGTAFHVHTIRRNPAKPGAVTGNATYASFFGSLLGAQGKLNGVHIC